MNLEAISFLLMALLFSRVSGMQKKYKQQLLKLHNDARSKEGGSDMNELVWDDVLEEEALEWANGCVYEHQYKERGENLAMMSFNWSDTKLINRSFKGWFDEKLQYRYGQRTCSESQSCHYTQLVWSSTRRMGCAMRWCDSLINSYKNGRAWYIVCFYDPKGNFQGERPYTRGSACTKCRDDQTCRHRMCSGGEDPCDDVIDGCANLVEDGLCYSHRAAMKDQCQKSCGLCTGAGKKINWKPKTKSGECKDRNKSCPRWSQRDGCKRTKTYMERNCKMTCGLCPGKKNTQSTVKTTQAPRVCKDEDDRCEYWAKVGNCERNKRYMRRKCRKSCQICGGGGGDRGGNKTGGKVSRVCKDEDDRCEYWAGVGNCERNKNYMRRKCKKSCQVCGGTGRKPSVCEDTDKRCSYWAQAGDCGRNPEQMKWRCKKSCGACTGGGVKTPSLCKDNQGGCSRWAERGFCERNPTMMRRECKKSCKKC